MKKVFIKYNPYRIETKITVDYCELYEDSKIRDAIADSRLQDWAEDLPAYLVDDYADYEYEISFHGTVMDFEDLQEAFDRAENIKAVFTHIPAKESSDKEIAIADIFKKIQEGPFEELKSPEIINAFNNAMSSEFEVCVVATMSSGKSTLINSFLQKKLMPSKQTACTAKITRIKDNDTDRWVAKAYDINGNATEVLENAAYCDMLRLNNDDNILRLDLTGEIPFVEADKLSLMLIDTPGPNNALNTDHGNVQNEFLNSSSKTLVLYVMDSTFGTSDDVNLLEKVAASISNGEKQSRDRYIFVINKMDQLGEDDESVSVLIQNAKEYLEKQNIINPNIFPVAALPALKIKMVERGEITDEDEMDEIEFKARKICRKERYHLEKHSPLPKSISNEIDERLAVAIDENNKNEQAYIHTGIPSLEKAISIYVQKYAKTAKVKNIAETFTHKLEQTGCIDKAKLQLSNKQESIDSIVDHIRIMKSNLSELSGKQELLKNAESNVEISKEVAVKTIKSRANNAIIELNKLLCEYENKGTVRQSYRAEAEKIANEIFDKINTIKDNYIDRLDKYVTHTLISEIMELNEEYNKNLSAVFDDSENRELFGDFDPIGFIQGNIVDSEKISIWKYMDTRKEEYIKLGAFDFIMDPFKGVTPKYEADYYNIKALCEEIQPLIEEPIIANRDVVIQYVNELSDSILSSLRNERNWLNEQIQSISNELEQIESNKDESESEIIELREKVEWIEETQKEIDEIMEI